RYAGTRGAIREPEVFCGQTVTVVVVTVNGRRLARGLDHIVEHVDPARDARAASTAVSCSELDLLRAVEALHGARAIRVDESTSGPCGNRDEPDAAAHSGHGPIAIGRAVEERL